ncbi:MAG: phenylalanine--tRNA ligase subunit beta, partial [Candidatus Aenigmatarchaeota archaeon]
MPKLEISYSDLCSLIGKKIPIEKLKEDILFSKGEIDSVEGDLLKVDLKDSNRPDLWSAEGVAREIQGRVTSKVGLPDYEIAKGDLVVKVDKKVSSVRPLTVCAVVKGLKIDQNVLSQMIQLQEKVATTFGRNRKEVAIGVYDYHKIKPPIRYTTVEPEGIRFVPLEFKERMTPKEILEKHPKGKEFGHLLEGCKEYPIFIDAADEVLSLPPVINSDYTGKVEESTRDVFIECSGFNFKFLVPALNVLIAALADRGGKIESVRVEYPDRSIYTPDFTPKKASVDVNFIKKVSGLNLNQKEIVKLLLQARYNPTVNGKRIEVLYPAYRQDIMHPRDVVEDVMISYG